MLQHLHVKNYAIIEEVAVDFHPGFNVVTGETGAGKSILMDALSLVLGARADYGHLEGKDEKCMVEAHFDVRRYGLEDWFSQQELDYSHHLILRRELLPSQRSRAFINDTPVALKVMVELTTDLVSIHQQFAALDLFESDFQLTLLDAMAGQLDAVTTYRQSYRDYGRFKAEMNKAQEEWAALTREQDFLQFQLDEIDELSLDVEVDGDIDARLRSLELQGERMAAMAELVQHSEASEDSIQHRLQQMLLVLRPYATDDSMRAIIDRLEAVEIELTDLMSTIAAMMDEPPVDAHEMQAMRERQDALNRLMMKHGVQSIAALATHVVDMRTRRDSGQAVQDKVEELKRAVVHAEAKASSQAQKISDVRQATVSPLLNAIQDRLGRLGMDKARCAINLSASSVLNPLGQDEISFTFAANPGSPMQALAHVASGGELSRLALAVKSIVAGELKLPTMIFDEIDSGVSGDTALRMAQMLADFSSTHQTIVITHSPQVAATGDHHYFISKSSDEVNTRTHIRELIVEDRVQEIAKMLSGDPPSKEAVSNAEVLLGQVAK